ncbi:hypothetical protein RCEC007_1160002 [Escherichia coli]|nr:hypothetical protein RCEC007_1160002 [Escherichia coli]
MAYEHTGSRREEDEVGAHTGAKADSVNPKSRTREDRQDRSARLDLIQRAGFVPPETRI